MSNQLYVGFTGKAGAGKDFVADYIYEKIGTHVSVSKVPWAAGVREDIEQNLHIDRIPVLWQKPTTLPVRRLLQWWGTEFRRSQDVDYWVKWGMSTASDRMTDVIFFTDTRFENEVDAITELGGLIFNIRANEEVRIDRIGVTPSHASEDLADLLPANLTIHNDGGLPDVHVAVQLIKAKVRGLL